MKQPLQPDEEDAIRKILENKIGRQWDEGLHGQILREVSIRPVEFEDSGEHDAVVTAVIEGNDLDVQALHGEDLEVLSVEPRDIEGYRSGFAVHVHGVVEKAVEKATDELIDEVKN